MILRDNKKIRCSRCREVVCISETLYKGVKDNKFILVCRTCDAKERKDKS
jgi:hypothetical protein